MPEEWNKNNRGTANPVEMKTIDEQIKCVQREIAMRERVYPAWVASGKMRQIKADHELDCMRSVLETLDGVQGSFIGVSKR